MSSITARFPDLAYALLRIVTGLVFAEHGVQKLFGLLGGKPVPLPSQFGVAGVIELTAGTMVALGIFPRWAALIASGEMAVAYWTQHAPHGFWPIVNHGELA